MTHELRGLGLSCSENRVARLMHAQERRAQPRKPFRPKTTRADQAAHCFAQSPRRGRPTPPAPGTHLLSDITYIPTAEGWLYLAVVLDLFSRTIIGWKLSDSLPSPRS